MNNYPRTGMPPAPPPATNLFTAAPDEATHLTVMYWGDSGTGKTRAGLTWPRPAVIDIEGLAKVYRHEYPAARFYEAHDLESVKTGIQSIIADGGKNFDTLVIDSSTVLYNQRQGYHLERKGFLSRAERDRINTEMDEVYRLLSSAPVHVVYIVRETSKYDEDAEKPADQSKKIGVRPDIDKSAPYIVNFRVHTTSRTLEKIQGLPIPNGAIADFTYPGYFKAVEAYLSTGKAPDDITTALGRQLFFSYWTGKGLTADHIKQGLNVKSATEWTKGRVEADKVLTAFAVDKGLMQAPPASTPTTPPPAGKKDKAAPPPPASKPKTAPPGESAYDLGEIEMELGDLFKGGSHLKAAIQELIKQEMITEQSDSTTVVRALKVHLG